MSIGIPLALLIICTENAQATGVLMAQGYKPPNSGMAIYGSIVGLIGSFFGAHAINIAGPMTAICSAKEVGKKESRYAASVANGVFFSTLDYLPHCCSFCDRHAECNCYCDCWISYARCFDQFT